MCMDNGYDPDIRVLVVLLIFAAVERKRKKRLKTVKTMKNPAASRRVSIAI